MYIDEQLGDALDEITARRGHWLDVYREKSEQWYDEFWLRCTRDLFPFANAT